jgi:hypothetical protein
MENLMARPGRIFDENDIERIVSLLASTDMTVAEIAQRMSCSRSAILAINRKRQVRNYGGHHTSWQVCYRNGCESRKEADVAAKNA